MTARRSFSYTDAEEVSATNNCCLPVSIGPLACAIAENFGTDELNVLAIYITSLGDALSLIAAQRVAGESKCSNKPE